VALVAVPTRVPRLRIVAAVVVGLAILVLALVQLWLMRPGRPPLMSAREALLSRQNQELVKLAADAENGTLSPHRHRDPLVERFRPGADEPDALSLRPGLGLRQDGAL
jgi:hypothetical protein